MWSNDGVADDPDDASPWTRDDWVPDSAVPDEHVFGVRRRATVGQPGAAEPPPEDFDDPDGDPRTSGSSAVRRIVAAGVIIALLVGSAGALLRNGDEPETEPEPRSTRAEVVVSAPTTSTPATMRPTNSILVTVPVSPEPDQSVQKTSAPPVVVGDVPAWAERTITVPEPLARWRQPRWSRCRGPAS